MTSEIRVNKLTNRVGLGTVEYTNTGIVVSGISTSDNFKTGTSNLHSTGLNIFDLDVDGHTNLDNVSIAGVSTFTGQARFNGELVGSTISVLSGYSINIPDKFIHSGDSDTAIRFPSNDTISFETGGGERLRITSTGLIRMGNGAEANTEASITACLLYTSPSPRD